jgi:hypothetical protein
MFSPSPRDVDSIAQSPWYIPVVANSAQNKRVACMVGVDILRLRDDSSSELRSAVLLRLRCFELKRRFLMVPPPWRRARYRRPMPLPLLFMLST